MTARVPDVSPPRGGGSLMAALRLAGRNVLVVGGGQVAAGRVRAALEADAEVTVIAPRLTAELRHRWQQGDLHWRPDVFHDDDLDLDDLALVLSCLDDPEVSRQIAEGARARRILVNCADIPALCDLWFASAHREGPLQLALSTNGQGPALGSRLVREILDQLPQHIGRTLARFGVLRQAIRQAAPAPSNSPRRMSWLTALSQGWSWEALGQLDDARIHTLVEAFRAGGPPPDDPTCTTSPRVRKGRVSLVGAGPGDPDLLTDAARRALADADLVLADRLVPEGIRELARGEVRIARKFPGRSGAAQQELMDWAVEAYRRGDHVVRLKCGDPFLFGRGGEEILFLAEQGIDAEVHPGITSAFAAPLAAGIPTTMRGYADRVLVMTGQGKDGRHVQAPAFDDHTTYVVLMGVGRMGTLSDAMIAQGFPPDWPAAVVERATHPEQRVVRGTLSSLHALADAAGIQAPATLVVGRVVDALAAESVEVAETVAAAG